MSAAAAEVAAGARIVFRHVSQRFGASEVLKALDLSVVPGSFLAVVGRSGSGKSTLLRILAGLDRPASGSLVLEPGGAPVRMMFQEPRLLPWASVLSNVEVGLGTARTRPDATPRARQALASVGLTAKAGAWPSQLSGGQRQRVALARALVSRPAVLALDEPLGALDALTRIEMQRLVEAVWQDQRFTAVLVTHDVGEAVALADRVVMIEHGRIALDVPIELDRPRHRGSPGFAAYEALVLDRILGAHA